MGANSAEADRPTTARAAPQSDGADGGDSGEPPPADDRERGGTTEHRPSAERAREDRRARFARAEDLEGEEHEQHVAGSDRDHAGRE